MPAYDITLYAKWDADKVNYTVEHLVEKLDGSYELYDRQAFTSDTDSQMLSIWKDSVHQRQKLP
jgi:hypothetical protein